MIEEQLRGPQDMGMANGSSSWTTVEVVHEHYAAAAAGNASNAGVSSSPWASL